MIEAKLNASNKTVPRSKNPLVKKKYVAEGCEWYADVFKSDFETVAISARAHAFLKGKRVCWGSGTRNTVERRKGNASRRLLQSHHDFNPKPIQPLFFSFV